MKKVYVLAIGVFAVVIALWILATVESPPPSDGVCHEERAPFGGGQGTSTDPYLICTSDHLHHIATSEHHLDRSFLITRDIDMGDVDAFNVIGTEIYSGFSGHFDGDDHRIDNLTLVEEIVLDESVAHTSARKSSLGMFGRIEEEGVVENLVLSNVDVEGTSGVAALAGDNYGEIRNVEVSGAVRGKSSVGGLVSNNRDQAKIIDSSSTAEITGTDGIGKAIGGLVGSNRGRIHHSSASSSVDGLMATGGLVGSNSGTVIESEARGEVTGENIVGGLLGSHHQSSAMLSLDDTPPPESLVTRSTATGVVEGHLYAGGLIGSNDGRVTESAAYGDVSGKRVLGGLIGVSYDQSTEYGTELPSDRQAPGQVEDSKAFGSVQGTHTVGGLLGINLGVVTTSYTAGDVSGDESVGALIGKNYPAGDVTASYWDRSLSTADDRHGGTPLSTKEFAHESSFDGWDFDDTWVIDTSYDDEPRPRLQ